MLNNCSERIFSESHLRDVLGVHSGNRVTNKVTDTLDHHCRAFIGASPFVLIASSDAQGNLDISPRGGSPGFVNVLDDRALAIAEQPGNGRAETFSNVLQSPKVALFFMLPGRRETLRITGTAAIFQGKESNGGVERLSTAPAVALVVTIEEAFFYCSKSISRSKIWQPDCWPDLCAFPPVRETRATRANTS